MPETTLEPRIVYALPDGRLFVPDTAIVGAPELAKWFATTGSNYWQRHPVLFGYVGPMEIHDDE